MLFKRRVVVETILKAFTVALAGFLIVITVTMLLTITESGDLFIMYLFEASSAFGTVGLSMGLTPDFHHLEKSLLFLRCLQAD